MTLSNKVWKNVRLSVNKYEQYLAKEYQKSAEKQLLRWNKDVVKALSDPLDEKYWHSLRPIDRAFPYLNIGTLRDSISSGVKFKVTGQGNYSITAWADISAPHAQYTNHGFRKRADGGTPKWVGWVDDVFKGTRGFNSVEDIFELLVLERRGL